MVVGAKAFIHVRLYNLTISLGIAGDGFSIRIFDAFAEKILEFAA